MDRLAVRAISPRFLSEEERIQVADLRRERLSIRQIAAQLNRSPSTISRELRRNTSTPGTYRPPRRPPTGRRSAGTPSSAANRIFCRIVRCRVTVTGTSVESATDQPPSGDQISRRTSNATVSRAHLTGPLPARISADATLTTGTAAAITVAHRPPESSCSRCRRPPFVPDLNTRCSLSISVQRVWQIGTRPDIGNLNAVVKQRDWSAGVGSW